MTLASLVTTLDRHVTRAASIVTRCRQRVNSVCGTGQIAAVGAAIALALCLPFQAGAQGGFNGPGRYEITNLQSGKVLDLDRKDQTQRNPVLLAGHRQPVMGNPSRQRRLLFLAQRHERERARGCGDQQGHACPRRTIRRTYEPAVAL